MRDAHLSGNVPSGLLTGEPGLKVAAGLPSSRAPSAAPAAAPRADRSRRHRCNSHSPPPRPKSHRHPLGLSVPENLLESRLDLTVLSSEAHRGSMSLRAVQSPSPVSAAFPALPSFPRRGHLTSSCACSLLSWQHPAWYLACKHLIH